MKYEDRQLYIFNKKSFGKTTLTLQQPMTFTRAAFCDLAMFVSLLLFAHIERLISLPYKGFFLGFFLLEMCLFGELDYIINR